MDILENEVMDTRLYFARMCYNPDFVSHLPGGWDGQGLTADSTLVCHLHGVLFVI